MHAMCLKIRGVFAKKKAKKNRKQRLTKSDYPLVNDYADLTHIYVNRLHWWMNYSGLLWL